MQCHHAHIIQINNMYLYVDVYISVYFNKRGCLKCVHCRESEQALIIHYIQTGVAEAISILANLVQESPEDHSISLFDSLLLVLPSTNVRSILF